MRHGFSKNLRPLRIAGILFLVYLANVFMGKASMFLLESPKVFLSDVLEFLVLFAASVFFVIAILISEFELESDPNQFKKEI